MQSLLELAPIAVFVVAYLLRGVYVATAALMVSMALLLIVDLVRLRRVPTMHALSAALVFVFGAATLYFHNARFIQWKLTVFCWLASLAFLLSFWIGRRPLVQNLLAQVLETMESVPARLWRWLNWQWVAFYGAFGAANLLIAYHASERTWVYFKGIGFTVCNLLLLAGQFFWLLQRGAQPRADTPSAKP